MDCEKAREQLNAYVDGEIGGEEAEYITAHIAECQHCAAEHKSLRSLRRLVSRYGAVPSPQGILDELHERLMEEDKRTAPVAKRPRRTAVSLRWMGLAASFVLLVAGGIYLNIIQREPETGFFKPAITQQKKAKQSPPQTKSHVPAAIKRGKEKIQDTASQTQQPEQQTKVKTEPVQTAKSMGKIAAPVSPAAPTVTPPTEVYEEKQEIPEPPSKPAPADYAARKDLSQAQEEEQYMAEHAETGIDKAPEAKADISKAAATEKPSPPQAQVTKGSAMKLMEAEIAGEKKAETISTEQEKGLAPQQPMSKPKAKMAKEKAKKIASAEEAPEAAAGGGAAEEKTEEQAGEVVEIRTTEVDGWKKQVEEILNDVYKKEADSRVEKRDNVWLVKVNGKKIDNILSLIKGIKTPGAVVVHYPSVEKTIAPAAVTAEKTIILSTEETTPPPDAKPENIIIYFIEIEPDVKQ
ncbi:MAG: zf-HC2 domain-containing protein [bacterium]